MSVTSRRPSGANSTACAGAAARTTRPRGTVTGQNAASVPCAVISHCPVASKSWAPEWSRPFCSTSGARPDAADRSKSRMVGWPSSAENADNHRALGSKSSPTTPGTVARTLAALSERRSADPARIAPLASAVATWPASPERPTAVTSVGCSKIRRGGAVQFANDRKYTARPTAYANPRGVAALSPRVSTGPSARGLPGGSGQSWSATRDPSMVRV